MSGRARRATVKKIDYAKANEFSDDEAFGDSADDEPQPQVKSRGRKPGRSKANSGVRKVEVAINNADDDDDEEDLVYQNKSVYIEPGYDPSLPPLRERFPFLPEYEEDGSPKIDLIVGRRPIGEKDDAAEGAEGDAEEKKEDSDPKSPVSTPGRAKRGGKASKSSPLSGEKSDSVSQVEWEYLVKYRGRSYLHLEWKTGADLESMNKSAKGIYRRYLKKVNAGTEEDIENPEFDPSFALPEKIVDEKEQEITIELTDEELLKLEKARDKRLAQLGQDDEDDDDDDDSGKDNDDEKGNGKANDGTNNNYDANGDDDNNEESQNELDDDWMDEEIDFSTLTLDKLRSIVNRDGLYYPKIKGSSNAYRDGYTTEPPKKPRASYIFFQCAMRPYYQKRNPGAPQSELMTILGNLWQSMSEDERAPFVELANEESKQYEKEKVLLEKAQKPNEVWQPLRRCRMVLERLASDSFTDIFLEPVDTNEFDDYMEIIDQPMDISTVRKNLEGKKYIMFEQFARDMRKIWNNCKIYNQHGSAIWYVADYMSKQFERLYHAWVLDFRERYIRWADPRARPWEHTCRIHDGKCKTPDREMVLCDHCDGMYGIKCLTPPLKPYRRKHGTVLTVDVSQRLQKV